MVMARSLASLMFLEKGPTKKTKKTKFNLSKNQIYLVKIKIFSTFFVFFNIHLTPIYTQHFFPIVSDQIFGREKRTYRQSQGTQTFKALGEHLGGHLERTRDHSGTKELKTLGHLEHSDTWALGHLGPWVLGHSRHSGTYALEALVSLGTQDTLFRRLIYDVSTEVFGHL